MKRRFLRLQRSIGFIGSVALVSVVLVTIVTWRLPVRPETGQATTSIRQIYNQFQGMQSTSDKPRQCTRNSHVGFLKIHKAGSTTISNILQRYGIRNNLNIVLPNKKKGEYGFNYLGHARNFTMKSVIPIPEGERYHILCNHVIYNRTMFRKLLPNDTLFFAVVREPEDRFISAAFYYGLVKSMKNKIPGVNNTNYIFSRWLQDPFKYGASMETYNHVAYDFGIEQKYFHNVSYVERYVQGLEQDFDLVLLMNYFDESLILLRRRLCWNLKDIIYLKRNSGKITTKFALSEEDRAKLRKWQMADSIIYDRFRSRFWRQIEAEGHDLFLETEFFKGILRRVSDYCEYGQKFWPSVNIEASTWNEAFNVTKKDCNLMGKSELDLVKELQINAWIKYNASLHET